MRVLGCDPSTKRCALADNTGRMDSITLHPRDDNGKRLAWSFRQIEIFTRQFVGDDPPEMVIVEQPMASRMQKVHPSLFEMCGVTKAAIYSALENLYATPVPIFTMPPPMWKSAVLGKGNASKEDYCEWVLDQGKVWANDDEAAAYCLSLAGDALGSVKA